LALLPPLKSFNGAPLSVIVTLPVGQGSAGVTTDPVVGKQGAAAVLLITFTRKT
jgi:hypothetical protein